MFLRKLLVMVVPLLLAAALCLLLPLLSGLGFWSNVLKGMLMGIALALLLPLSGATRRKEPFATLLAVPLLLLVLTVIYQYLASIGAARIPVLDMLATSEGQVVLVECVFIGYMGTQALRTRR
ncbi:MAG: hypothetical protein J1E43_10185 [Christensenellaceae bacterium]|nr:hypothetical protein [Christensenellaceae bacterium]